MKYSIGIDPGKNTGFAVYDIQKDELCRVETSDFWGVVSQVVSTYPSHDVFEMTIELPTTRHVWHNAANVKTAGRTGLHVGMALREAELLVDYFKKLGYHVRTIAPRGKLDRYKFAGLTGWTKRCSQHARDAAVLCYKRKP